MDLELALIASLTRRLPTFRGPGRVANLLKTLYLRRPRGDVEAAALGLRLVLRPAEFVEGWLLFAPQYYERREIDLVRHWLIPGDTFVDVGAHIGLYALIASLAVGPNGAVVAIEADPATFGRLNANIALNRSTNVTSINVGVSDRHEVLRLGLNSSGNEAGNSFLLPATNSVEVECKPLAEVLNRLGISRIAGAKFDIEGFEFRVLARFLADAPKSVWPRWMIVERYAEWIPLAGGDVLELLSAHGYGLHRRYGANYIFTLAPD
jgi:FkbM family methyltransferase